MLDDTKIRYWILPIQSMETSSFDVDAFSFIEITASDLLNKRKILVPGSFLQLNRSDVIALERQSQPLKQAKRIAALIPIKVDLNDYLLFESSRQNLERIFAHAIARSNHTPPISGNLPAGLALPSPDANELVDYRTGDQFFLMHKSPEQFRSKREKFTSVINIRTGHIGLIPSACLMFYPHMKAVEEFEWATTDEKKVSNKIGDFFTVTQGTWDMNWGPEGKPGKKHPFTFGRNHRTGYTGLIRIATIVELKLDEIETWKRINLLPSSTSYTKYPKRKHSNSDQEPCSGNCQQTIDAVAEFKRANKIQDYKATIPKWRLLEGVYNISKNRDEVERGGSNISGWMFYNQQT